MIKRQRILVTGRVQGVGFRPTVYQIAQQLGLTGFVYNDTKGVTIELQGDKSKIDKFLVRLQSSDKPPLAEIKTCETIDIAVIEAEDKFAIKASDSKGTALSQVTADMAACADCLAEMADKNDFRYGYPFINCTNCGPRYSIVKSIPYDRPNTTMSTFAMWVVVVLLWRYISLASIAASVTFPAALILAIAMIPGWNLADLWPLFVAATAIPAMVIVRHRENIKRLIAGTESKVFNK